MKRFLYFLLFFMSEVAIGRSINLDLNFTIKSGFIGRELSTKQLTTNFDINEENVFKLNGYEETKCMLYLQAKEQNETEVKISAEIFKDNKLIARPIMVIPYNQRGILEIGDAPSFEGEYSSLSLTIIPSKVSKIEY